MILSREEFANHFNQTREGLGDPKSPLWTVEMNRPQFCSQWFVCVDPVLRNEWEHEKINYWDWCDANLQGRVLCYSSDDISRAEWWGFTKYNDIVLWLLKWG